MANRFERLFQLPTNQHIDGSPIILSAGVLSKDTETGSVITQLKFQSVSEKRIRAVKVSLAAYDISKTEIQGVHDYQYLEMDIANGQEFGSNKAIVMPNAVTRSFALSSIVVVFKDGSMWENTSAFEVLPAAKTLPFGNPEMEKQYRIATNNDAKFEPCISNGLWQCACGKWNNSNVCTQCRATKDAVFSAYNIPVLTDQMNIRLAAEAERQRLAAEKEAEEQAKRAEAKKSIIKKAKLITAIVIPVVILALLFTQWLLPDIIQPAIAYSKAEKMLSAGQYDDAEKAFLALGEYRDASEMALETRYQKACWLMENGNNDAAMEVFSGLINYGDSSDRIEEIVEKSNDAAYTAAQELLKDAQYDAAISAFSALGNYKNSAEMVSESLYQKALFLADAKNYKESINILEQLGSYSETESYLESIKYQYAGELFAQGKYDEAKSIYATILSYEDSSEMMSECDYQKAAALSNTNAYEEAIELFTQISQYKDSSSQILHCKYQLALVKMANSQHSAAMELLEELADYKDAAELLLEAKYEVAKEYISYGNYYGDYQSAITILDELGNYKDSASYRKLIAESKCLAYQRNDGFRYWYLSVYTVIDIENCSLQLMAQEVRSKDYLRNEEQMYSIDYLWRFEEWKIENGKYLMVFEGSIPTEDRHAYREWTILSNWGAIRSQTLLYTGEILGEPGDYVDTYTRITDEDVVKTLVGRTRKHKGG